MKVCVIGALDSVPPNNDLDIVLATESHRRRVEPVGADTLLDGDRRDLKNDSAPERPPHRWAET